MFDKLKIDVLDYTVGVKADPRRVELIEEAGFIFGQSVLRRVPGRPGRELRARPRQLWGVNGLFEQTT